MWHLAWQAAVIKSESLHDFKAKAAILSAFIGEEEGNVLNQLNRSLSRDLIAMEPRELGSEAAVALGAEWLPKDA
jgi:hypothetical protein